VTEKLFGEKEEKIAIKKQGCIVYWWWSCRREEE